MTKANSTKKALLSSAFALLVCVAMLIGTTFAWFTDTASTAVNRIQAGTLKIDIVDKENRSLDGQTLSFKNNVGSADILWEPGATFNLDSFKIVNNGNLALKYKVIINGVDGNAKLLEAIDFTVKKDEGEPVALENWEGVLLPEGREPIAGDLNTDTKETAFITVSGHMKEDAGNEYQGKELNGIGITVVATQYTYEYDSESNRYDEEATYPAVASEIKKTYGVDGLRMPTGVEIAVDESYSTAQGMGHYIVTLNSEEAFVYFTQVFDRKAACDARTEALNNGTAEKLPGESVHNNLNMWYDSKIQNITVKMGCDVDLNGMQVKTFGMNVNFDGQGHTIKNAKLTGASGFFTLHTAVSNVTLDNIHVTATGLEYAGVVEGFSNKNITNVTVKNSSVIGGKYTGAIVGDCYANITDCTVENTVVSGQYKVGGLIGYICSESTTDHREVTGNKLTNVTVKGENIWPGYSAFCIGKLVGHWNNVAGSGTCKNNTFSGTTEATANIGRTSGTVTE